MIDLVERLRKARDLAECWKLTEEAADEILRLRALLEIALSNERDAEIERRRP